VAIAAGSVSYALCTATGDKEGETHSLRHSHGGYEHIHHHHHSDTAGGNERHDNHEGCDHLPLDLKAVWTAASSRQTESPPLLPQATCVALAINECQACECRGVPPPRAGPDPTRQLRQIRSNVLLV
jgi:hypothetical protein